MTRRPVGPALVAALVAAGAGGCWSMAPKYERPAMPVTAELPGADSASGSGGSGAGAGSGSGSAVHIAELPWSQLVRDPRLREVVTRALANSRDLRRAALSIEAARAQYRIQRAAELPSIDAVAAITSTRQIFEPPTTPTITTTSYTAEVGLSAWEIDLFGRLRSLTESRRQAVLSTLETARATRVSLIGETVTAWLTMAADLDRLAIARDTMASGKRTMDLTDQLVGGGTSNRGDYWQAATIYQQARADVAQLTAAIAQDRDALELLVGARLDDAVLPTGLPADDALADVPVGLSSDALLDRPDVRAAEHDLMAANADIGAARAQFLPSLTLTANGGLASTALATLFTGPIAVWTIAPALAMPLFRGGANRANLAYTETQKRSYIAAYELAIQRAFRDVADALATRGTITEQLAAQTALVDAAQKGFDLSKARYDAGVDTFLATLVNERALYTARGSLVSARLTALGNRVTLYRALGGGASP